MLEEKILNACISKKQAERCNLILKNVFVNNFSINSINNALMLDVSNLNNKELEKLQVFINSLADNKIILNIIHKKICIL